MTRILEYQTVHKGNFEELDLKIAALLKAGWQPHGSPYYVGKLEETSGIQVCQAMVKYAEETPK